VIHVQPRINVAQEVEKNVRGQRPREVAVDPLSRLALLDLDEEEELVLSSSPE